MYMNTSTAAPSLIWTLSGQQGSQWLEAQIPVQPILSVYSVYFEGIRGASFTGDIAIDDITFQQASCGCKLLIKCLLYQGLQSGNQILL